MTAFMRAIVVERYGGPDRMQLRKVPRPEPQPDEVQVRIHATSINDWDWGLLRGEFTNRLLNGLFRPKRRQIFGSDIAGRVESVGSEVVGLQVGDEVYGDLSFCGFGGFAEYVCAPASAWVRKPATMSFEQAAAIPQAGLLAFQALRGINDLASARRILINGAGGGFGSLAIQLLVNSNAEFTGVDNAGKADLLRELGFHKVLDYAETDFTNTGETYDIILDAKTSLSPFAYACALNPGGTYATVGGSLLRMLQILLCARWLKATQRKHLRVVALKPNDGLDTLGALFEQGKLMPVIERTYSLEAAPVAMSHFCSGQHRGKLVISMP